MKKYYNKKLDRQLLDIAQTQSGGSLCIFGCWFDRPMDNYHFIINASFDKKILRVTFD